MEGLWEPDFEQFVQLNQITSHGVRMFITVAVDVVITGLREPARFTHEAKIRVFPKNETFWNFGKRTLNESFTLTICEHTNENDRKYRVGLQKTGKNVGFMM